MVDIKNKSTVDFEPVEQKIDETELLRNISILQLLVYRLHFSYESK